MGYLSEFKERLRERNPHKILELWQEYLTVDSVDSREYISVLEEIKASDQKPVLANVISLGLPMWEQIESDEDSFRVLKLINEMSPDSSSLMREKILDMVHKRWPEYAEDAQKLKWASLRDEGSSIQGSLAAFELLIHFKKGNFVYHLGGWGVGEIMEVSLIRELIVVEFEHVSAKKEISFANAFKILEPRKKEHFLSRRFGFPDELESEARKDPVGIICLLLSDLGPMTAAEIKDELIDLVIPEKDWHKWWQLTRTKLKKDSLIETPDSIKEPFILREKAKTSFDLLEEFFTKGMVGGVEALYNLIRDFPVLGKDVKSRTAILSYLREGVSKGLSKEETVLFALLGVYLGEDTFKGALKTELSKTSHPVSLVMNVPVQALKKIFLQVLAESDAFDADLFIEILEKESFTPIKEWTYRTLENKGYSHLLKDREEIAIASPQSMPEFFLWLFARFCSSIAKDSQKREQSRVYLESVLKLLNIVENRPQEKEFAKKIYSLLTDKRWELVRDILPGADITYLKEMLLLASKCHTFSDNDLKILRSLSEVVCEDLKKASRKHEPQEENIIFWALPSTVEKKTSRLKEITEVDLIENSKDIETARAHGDLRENGDYKAALERKRMLQMEMKEISSALQNLQVIHTEAVSKDMISVGHKVSLKDKEGNLIEYTLLGPWEADPEKGVISVESHLGKALLGKRKGEKLSFKDTQYEVFNFESAIDMMKTSS